MVLAIAAAAVFLFIPSAVPVETVAVSEGLLAVTIDGQGETRAHDRYVVATPVPGRLQRVDLHEGDEVKAGDTVALLHVAPLGPQEREAQVARVEGGEALRREAEDNVRKSRTALAQAERERARTERLVAERFVSPQALDRAMDDEATARAELDAALARSRAAAAQLAAARAGLTAADPGSRDRPIPLRAPSDGEVLRIVEKSERILSAGAPVLVIGDPRQLEVVVDLLSTEAVKVRPGMAAKVVDWGGPQPLDARVRVVEPAAFTKVSSLGVEEQRVNVVLDVREAPAALGDAFRVEVRILQAEAQARKAPASALFHVRDRDAVFIAQDGRARLRVVEPGLRNRDEVEVRSGLEVGERVVRFPTGAIREGVRVRELPGRG
jgi:HlyD family secretion protein